MARPVTTLLIGLGGSGAWTVVHTKRQLFDAYNNRVPDNVSLVVLDTAQRSIVGRGAEGLIRQEGMGIGQTVVDRQEMAHVGGDAYDLVRDFVDTNKKHHYQHITSWFLAERFLADLPRASFALDEGAGQFRQFGRLALFRDVMTPNTSAVASIIDNKLRSLQGKRQAGEPAMSVVITGSLAGGTGAGLFIDVAHLVRRVAEIYALPITLRGFLYMPEAFSGNLSRAELEPAQGRAFAAMRELERFLLNSDYEYGYPMHYHGARSGMNDDLWRSSNTGKLYDYVYFIDGGDMNRRKLEEGSASVVADAIINFIDENYGPKQAQYDVNVRGKINDRQARVGKRAFISTLGAYSIIMPIQQITEGWAYKLSLDFVHTLVPGKKNERNHLTSLTTQFGSTTSKDEVQRLCKSLTAVIDPRDPNRTATLQPLPLWGKVFDIHNNPETDQNRLNDLARYDLVDWMESLVPPASENDPEVTNLRTSTINILSQHFNDFVETSAEKENGDPETDFVEIEARANRFINSQLGMPVSGGGRQGGDYNDKLQLFVDLQARRFRGYMTGYMRDELNGIGADTPERGKAGKLGRLIAVFTEMEAMFSAVNSLLNRLITGSDMIDPDTQRAEVQEELNARLEQMKADKAERGMFGRIKGSPAVRAQEAYISAVQDYVDYYRMEFARNGFKRSIEAIIEFTKEILIYLRSWRDTLATDTNSLYNALYSGSEIIRADRSLVAEVANHRLIHDPEWEDGRYNEYMTDELRADLFERWQWGVRLVTEGGRERLSMAPGFRPKGENETKVLQRPDKRANWWETNRDLVLQHTRQIFLDAVEEESILEYLMQRTDPQQLAAEISDKASYLLKYNATVDAQSMIQGYILLARSDNSNPEQRRYLQEINRELAARNNQGDISEQDNPTQVIESCADSFRLTLLQTLELLPMNATRSYQDGRAKYMGLPYDTRQKNHIFPAEVHAIDYERRFSELEQRPRILTDRVALLLENEERFLQFLVLLTYRLIVQRERDEGQLISRYWALRARTQDPNRDHLEEWMLTAPSREAPSLLDAAISFVIRGHDISNSARRIPYDHIMDYLNLVIEHNTAKRIQENDIGRESVKMKQQLVDFSPPKLDNGEEDLRNWTEDDDEAFIEVAQFIARYDMLYELVREFSGYLDRLESEAQAAESSASDGQTHDDALRKKELLDMFTVSVIGLKREAEKLAMLVDDRHAKRIGEDAKYNLL